MRFNSRFNKSSFRWEDTLLDTAGEVIPQVYNSLKNYRLVLLVADAEGRIGHIAGNEDFCSRLRKYKIQEGEQLNDNLLISFSQPSEVIHDDWKVFRSKSWSCIAGKIYKNEKDSVGRIVLLGKFESVYGHLLAVLDATRMAIQNKLLAHKIWHSLHDNKQFIYGITNSIEFGVMAMDREGTILFVNDGACRRVNIRRRDLLNTSVAKIMPSWKSIFRQVMEGKRIINEELEFNNVTSRFVFNAMPILDVDGTNELLGAVISFRGMQRVINLVNKYTGMRARYTFDDIIHESHQMSELVNYVKTVADGPSTILIQGPSGTGKEVIAQSIHNASRRSECGFVAINCAAIAESLIESELFGYDDGAFTGAKKGGHPGKFELANHGTLFLDEIGEMPLNLQVKLLRVLQEGTVTRIGGDKEIPVDIRIIAATNKNLKEEVDKGNFRLDLYYRLHVIPIEIPALRERQEDILPLFKYFLSSKAVKLERNIPSITPKVHAELLSYSWPGNIRELENFAEMFINMNGKVKITHLEQVKEQNQQMKPASELSEVEGTLSDVEKVVIAQRLEKMEGNITRVAQSLGIGRNTLYQKMKKHGLD
ncbi:AAA family ATPase [Puteibacter caeruleilacunae]|nr:AAA family ATPase [Puteibacter caeruleilacunae]